ncbi:flippase-like domain-containing protein [Patescibacteria group bacterium]|nr:flippase-like domain-containing protein [Patescibacteria group bacterium]
MRRKRSKITFGRIIYLLVLGFFIYLVITKWPDVLNIVNTLQEVSLVYLILALLVQFLIMANQAKFYQESYRIFNLFVGWSKFFWLTTSANFISMISPSGGFVAGVAMIVRDGCQRGYSHGKLIFANVVYWVVYYVVFIFYLVVGVYFLLLKGQLADYMLLPAVILVTLVAVILVVLILALDDYERFKKLVIKFIKQVNQINNWLGRGEWIGVKSVKKYCYEVYEGYHFVIGNIYRMKKLILRASIMVFLNVVILSLLVGAFGGDWTSIGVLLSCYMIAALLMVVSITPSGAGIVELAMVSILSAFLLPVEKAIMVVVLYRLYQFWIPLLLGFISFRKVGKNL